MVLVFIIVRTIKLVNSNFTLNSEASIKAGFSRGYLGKVEREGVRITVEKLYQLARGLECDITDLLPADRKDLLDKAE
ncbi:helix-turn-helix transcriptional regulator [Vibrio splendidus]|nr:helix-turn-helix transcriptional regulator [Vibrio splendidus]PMH01695.1 transcriptional regulator [Vibrio splendidus]